jgi:nucleoid DNA-binding protein
MALKKQHLIHRISEEAEITRVQAATAMDAVIKGIIEALERGERVTVGGFGTFSASRRKARAGRSARSAGTISFETTKRARPETARVRIWYDPEGDYLEVMFKMRAGYFRETEHDQVMEKVDEEGNLLGFSVLRVSALKKGPLRVAL